MKGAGVPEDFAQAYGGLVALVGRVEASEVDQPNLGEEVDAYRRGDCRGSQTLAEAAALAFSYELSRAGLAEESEAVAKAVPEAVAGRRRALALVERVLRPPVASPDEPTAEEIVEVALPEELRRRMPNGRGFRMGQLQILFELIEGPPHAHLSVSHPDRYPLWEELLRARSAPGAASPNLWAWVPKPEQTSATNPRTVHLYVLPPEELLG